MWINNEVNIPEPLITAQREGKLVIFAGAGVSMGAPSNLPDFERLAREIARLELTEDDKNRLDWFLGRIKESGTDIQTRAREILSVEESEPTPLHYELVNLLGAFNAFRIVTTNFDSHFTTSLRKIAPDTTDIFYAPALPLGRNFKGLVYLHGSITRHEPLVLTDSNFGKAYLVDAWATRFLTEMFASFTVLFIGYSHKDPVMQYLARGFVADSERYALVAEPSNDEHWIHYGIIPVHYPLRPSPNEHGALTDAIEAWSRRVNMGVLEHENRIQQIVDSPPPIDNEILDYIESVIKDPITLRLFVSHAKDWEWLRWVEERGFFAELFTIEELDDEKTRLLASWFASRFAVEHFVEALNLIRKRGRIISVVLWRTLAQEMVHHDPKPDTEVLSKWVLILTETAKPWYDTMWLGLMLSEKLSSLDEHSAMLLFSYLTYPVAQLVRPWSADDEWSTMPGFELGIRSRRLTLDKAWTSHFLPRMKNFHKQLRPLLLGYLNRTESLTRAWGGLNLSNYRRAIEDHEQDRHKEEWQFLVDAIRDLLDWMLVNEPEIGEGMIAELYEQDSLLLKRLAIYGLAGSKLASPDAALERIAREHWLYDLRIKREVFRVIKYKFPVASNSAQNRFVKYAKEANVMPGQTDEEATDEDREISAYERYNVAVWLRSIAPDSAIAWELLGELQNSHPKFEPGDHPEFDFWSGEWEFIAPQSPISAEELAKKGPLDYLGFLLSYQRPGFRLHEPDRRGLLLEVQKVIRESFEWGWELAKLLADRSNWNTDLWPTIFVAWKETEQLTSEQRNQILVFGSEHSGIYDIADMEILRLLEHWLDNHDQEEGRVKLDLVEYVSDRIFENAREEIAEKLDANWDWLSLAINRIGGRVAIVWLKILSRRHQELKEQWTGIPADYRGRFEQLALGSEARYQFGRIVLAAQIQFPFGLDREWVERNLLYIFDWENDELIAEQSWNGFLYWGQWNEALFTSMLPFTEQMFLRQERLGERRDRFCDMLGAVAAYTTNDPWNNGWLMRFVRASDVDSRERWTVSFGRYLHNLSQEGVESLWQRWLQQYWKDRSTGVPAPLSDKEKEEMILLSIPLQSEFESVIDRIVANDAPRALSHGTLSQLEEANIASAHPRETVRLLLHVLSTLREMPYDGCEAIFKMAKEALGRGVDRDKILDIAEAIANLRCDEAMELSRAIERS